MYVKFIVRRGSIARGVLNNFRWWCIGSLS